MRFCRIRNTRKNNAYVVQYKYCFFLCEKDGNDAKKTANEVVFSCAQSGSFFIGGYDELFWATEQSIVQLVNHNKRVV